MIMHTKSLNKTATLTGPHDPSSVRYDIYSEDLMKACKSLFSRIDWSQVALDVVDNTVPASCRAGLQKSLQTKIEGVLSKACQDGILRQRNDMHFQQAEEIIKLGIYTESDEDGSGEESYEDSFVGGDQESYEASFVESDFSEAGSSEYQKSDDSADAEEDEDGVEDRRKICDVCRKSMNTTVYLK